MVQSTRFFSTSERLTNQFAACASTSKMDAAADAARPAKIAHTEPGPARIAVIGAAWWSQGWHLPQLQRNPDAIIAGIMQVCAKLQKK